VATPSTDDIKFVAGVQTPQYDEDGNAVERPELTPAEQKLLDKQRSRVKRHLLLWDEFGSIEAVGKRLYTKWVFPFEVTALLLLAAIVGAVVMAKRRL
jgi:hypothetical protein